MRRILPIALALLVPTATAATAASVPTLPPFIEKLVVSKAGPLAAAPTRLPLRYRYRAYKWNRAQRTLTLLFADTRFPIDGRHTITFTASRFPGPLARCGAGKSKTLQMGGNKVYWDGSVAWRCVRGSDGRNVALRASAPNLPDVALGRVIASAKRLSARSR
jgi:hypothetical protein